MGPTQLYWLIVHQSPKVFKSQLPWQPEETGSCGDVTLCFELFPRVDVNHWDLFSVKIRDVFYSTCVCRVTLESVWRQPGSLRLLPWSRQCHWDYSRLHNSLVIPAITIWHLCLGIAFNSQTGSSRAARPEPDDVTLSVKNMAFQVRGQTNLLTWVPMKHDPPCTYIWFGCQTVHLIHSGLRLFLSQNRYFKQRPCVRVIFIWLYNEMVGVEFASSYALTCRSTQELTRKKTWTEIVRWYIAIFFLFNLKAADNQNICAGLKSIPNCYTVRRSQTSDQMMSCIMNSSLYLPPSLSLTLFFLHFTTHATTSHLRNRVKNCVTVVELWYNMCV